jgi:hypothetical protein
MTMNGNFAIFFVVCAQIMITDTKMIIVAITSKYKNYLFTRREYYA